jgi:hypothetical protein
LNESHNVNPGTYIHSNHPENGLDTKYE